MHTPVTMLQTEVLCSLHTCTRTQNMAGSCTTHVEQQDTLNWRYTQYTTLYNAAPQAIVATHDILHHRMCRSLHSLRSTAGAMAGPSHN